MGIRESLNKNPLYTGIGAMILCGSAIAIAIVSNRDITRMRVASAYYSVDDGRTYFEDDVDRVFPFEHEGKQAYRVYVYQCGQEKPFVSYLARYDEPVRIRIEQLDADHSPEARGELAEIKSKHVEVKKPGTSVWTPVFSSQGQSITMHPKCPDGSIARAVVP